MEEIEIEKKPSGRGRRSAVSPMLWARIKMEFEVGLPIKELALKIGVKPHAIYSRAKREKWGKHGSIRVDGMTSAKEKALSEMTTSYADAVKNFNEACLKDLGILKSSQRGIVQALIRKIDYVNKKNADDYAKWFELEEYRKKEEGKHFVPSLPPMPQVCIKEQYALSQAVVAMKTILIDGERFILGITGGSLDRGNDDGALEIVKVLEAARQEYTAKARESIPDKEIG